MQKCHECLKGKSKRANQSISTMVSHGQIEIFELRTRIPHIHWPITNALNLSLELEELISKSAKTPESGKENTVVRLSKPFAIECSVNSVNLQVPRSIFFVLPQCVSCLCSDHPLSNDFFLHLEAVAFFIWGMFTTLSEL